MKNRFLFLFFAFALFVSGGLTSKWWLDNSSTAYAAEDGSVIPVQELQELSEIYTLIKQHYVETISGNELIEQAVRGMVASLDPHSSYLSKSEYDQFVGGLTNKEYGGVGTYIGEKDDWIEIISPIYDSPAYRADIKAGALILKIDGDSTQGMTVEDAVKKMRGEVGTVLELDILPAGGEVRHVELVRETIVTPSVLSSLIEGGYGYLRLTRFQNKTTIDLINGINGLQKEAGGQLKGIILDLRNNPGGYLQAGIDAAAVFLPSGSTVVLEKGRSRQVRAFTADAGNYESLENPQQVQKIPLVVLVNNGSASASEIVAGALQDHRRAVILGTRTYGKASVQSLVALKSSKGKSALRLTTARYFTPHDRNIQARGIEPDITVNPAEVREQQEGFTIREDDIGGHLENNSGNEAEGADVSNPEKQSTRPPFVAEEDYQYDQALQILRALIVTAAR
ncbi:MAG: S41 family peptidase [Proteobacteria bacterium]|nr:S41 family peptidase [Pseudomonadota bacterium]